MVIVDVGRNHKLLYKNISDIIFFFYRLYGVVLIGVYLVFVIVAILGETNVLPFNL